jgi:hypothetical protein
MTLWKAIERPVTGPIFHAIFMSMERDASPQTDRNVQVLGNDKSKKRSGVPRQVLDGRLRLTFFRPEEGRNEADLDSSFAGRPWASLGGLEGCGLLLAGAIGTAGKSGAYLTSCRDIRFGAGDCGEQQGALIAGGNRVWTRIAGKSAHCS